jgi:hypothetical protein
LAQAVVVGRILTFAKFAFIDTKHPQHPPHAIQEFFSLITGKNADDEPT